jgi:antitoxin ParD1/3/4
MPSSYTLGIHFEALVKGLVESSRYNHASEVVRDGSRLLEERERLREVKVAELRRLAKEGRLSGLSGGNSAYIARDNPARPVRFVQQLREHCRGLVAFPEARRLRPELGEGVRLSVFGNYIVLYVVREDILVIRRVVRVRDGGPHHRCFGMPELGSR